jgi:hypothetical protein
MTMEMEGMVTASKWSWVEYVNFLPVDYPICEYGGSWTMVNDTEYHYIGYVGWHKTVPRHIVHNISNHSWKELKTPPLTMAFDGPSTCVVAARYM